MKLHEGVGGRRKVAETDTFRELLCSPRKWRIGHLCLEVEGGCLIKLRLDMQWEIAGAVVKLSLPHAALRSLPESCSTQFAPLNGVGVVLFE